MASTTLDASAKIYAGRVDAIYSETYKVLTGLGRSDKNKHEGDDQGLYILHIAHSHYYHYKWSDAGFHNISLLSFF